MSDDDEKRFRDEQRERWKKEDEEKEKREKKGKEDANVITIFIAFILVLICYAFFVK